MNRTKNVEQRYRDHIAQDRCHNKERIFVACEHVNSGIAARDCVLWVSVSNFAASSCRLSRCFWGGFIVRHCLATRSVDFAELLVGWFSSTREEAMFPANSTTPDAAPQIGEQASAQQTNPQIVSNNGVVGTIATSSKSFPSLTTCEKCCTVPERALGPASQVKVCDNKHPSTHQNTSRPCVRSGNCPQMASSLETLVLFCHPGKSPFHVLPTGWVWMNRHENETKYDFSDSSVN